MQRVFFDWAKPALEQFAQYCIDNYTSGRVLDLSNHSIILPAQRSIRRFQEILLKIAQQKNLVVVPARHLTIGAFLKELLAVNPKPGYQESRQLAWLEVLKKHNDLTATLFPALVKDSHANDNLSDSLSTLVALAETLDNLYSELSANVLSASSVADFLQNSGFEQEAQRWLIIAKLVDLFTNQLEKTEVDHLALQLKVADQSALEFPGNILIAGCPDLSKLATKLLQKLNNQIDIIIFAPETMANYFDEYGVIKHAMWQRAVLLPAVENIYVTERAIDQVHLVKQILKSRQGLYSPEQISIATPVANSIAMLDGQLSELGISCHRAVGEEIKTTQVYLFLNALAKFSKSKSFSDFSSFCRHPIFLNYICERLDITSNTVLTTLDSYQNEHLPTKLEDFIAQKEAVGLMLLKIHTVVLNLIGNLLLQNQINAYCGELSKILDQVFFADSESISSAQQEIIANCLAAYSQCGQSQLCNFNNSEIAQLLVKQLANLATPEQPSGPAVDLLGWLELQLDDAPLKIITDCNQGLIPEACSADWLLPDGIRKKLGMGSNETRQARDAYLLSFIAAGSQELHLISTRQALNGDYLLPSGLLFDLDSNNLIKQLEKLIVKPAIKYSDGQIASYKEFDFPPKPLDSAEVNSVSVSALKSYLRCPYSFYLEHILRLQECDDQEVELSALNFGNLLHRLMSDFGKSDMIACDNEKHLRQYFNDLISKEINQYFGPNCEASVLIQIEQVRTRLNKFASCQCEKVQAGWRIIKTEWAWKDSSLIVNTNHGPIEIKGRIDRIDRFKDEERYAIYDYKTGDQIKPVKNAHFRFIKKTNEYIWKDLQLPAYGFALAQNDYPSLDSNNIEFGYINLSSELEKIGFDTVFFSEAELASSWLEIQNICENIKNNIFWPPKILPAQSSLFFRLYGNKLVLDFEEPELSESEEGENDELSA